MAKNNSSSSGGSNAYRAFVWLMKRVVVMVILPVMAAYLTAIITGVTTPPDYNFEMHLNFDFYYYPTST